MSWVTWIDIEDESTSKEEVRRFYKRTRNRLTKKIPDTVKLISPTPEVSGLMYDLGNAIQRNATGLTVREKEISALIVQSLTAVSIELPVIWKP